MAMLSIPEKTTVDLDLYRPLRHYISTYYSELDARSLEDDLQTVQRLRFDLLTPATAHRRDLLQSYFKALTLIESRFPISPDRDHVHSLTFTWFDAFKPSKRASQSNVHLEKSAVLFNLGAVCSQIGVSVDRKSMEGLKLACNSFQAAAGAFSWLRDRVSAKAAVGGATVDVSVECAGMLERLMLAQAQECFYEKVIGDEKPPGLCSKVSRQVGLYYEEAHAALSVPPLNQHFDRGWVSHVQLKAAHFYAEACYRYAIELHEKENIGEEIARLRIGLNALINARKSSKGVTASLLEAVSRLESNMNLNLERALKENDRVYMTRVPAASALTDLQAAPLVKPVSMDEVLDASKERLFSRVVPDGSAKALSRYTEMVDEVIRIQAEKLQQGSEITRVKLKEMGLPDSILALEGNITLPMDLKEDVEAVQISGGPSGLETEVQQLRDLRRVNLELLDQTEELLQKEAKEDADFQNQFGTRWTRPQSSTLTKNLQDRLNRFAGNIKQASDSDARIERALRDNSALMEILNHRPIEDSLPSLARPIMSLDGNEDALVGGIKLSLRQLETLGSQRAALEDMLKEMKRKDDIMPKLMASSGSYDDLFRREISKYDQICKEIAQNIEAQEQLLLQIQAQNDDFAAAFNLEDYKVSRQKCYKQIATAIAKYQEIKENLNEGLKFYVTLQDAITNVKQLCSDFVMTRNIQCKDMVVDVQRRVDGLHSSTDENSGNKHPYVGQSDPQRSTRQQPMPGCFQPYSSSQQPPNQASEHQHPQQSNNHNYGQPANPGWQGPYYNTHQQQQPDSFPPPPYTVSPNGRPFPQPPYTVPATHRPPRWS